ncbi:MAG: ABC transporter ATP-binding protein/permease [Nitrosopumilus sp.]|nr:ABC transporter ATP-binding protein/permease [Nitrosopumilus sp.]
MSQKSPLKYALLRLSNYKIALTVAIFWSIIFVIIPMQIPILTGSLIDGINGDQASLYGIIPLDYSSSQVLEISIIGLVAVAGIYGITAYFRTTSKAKISRNFVFDLQRDLAQKMESISLDMHSKYGSGDLLNRVILDTNSVRGFVDNTIIKTVVNIFRIIYPVIILFMMEPILAAIASSFLPFQFIMTQKLQKMMRKTARKIRKRRAKLTTYLKEDLDGIETVQTSNIGKHRIKKISKQVDRVEQIELRVQKYAAMITGLAWGLTTTGLAFTWWYGGLQVLDDNMTIGTLVTFTGLVVFIYAPIRRFSDVMRDYNKSIVAVERIQEILDLPSSVKQIRNAPPLEISKGVVEFENVSFAYRDSEVLSKVNLILKPKSLNAIVGKSGSGKSSFIRLIPRLYDPTNGDILIDGQNIRNVSIKSLRSQIALVTQDPIIFSGTIYENITLGNPNATNEEIEEACRIVDAYDFIMNLENDFQTVLGQGGTTLSKGQAQKITIARAVLRKPKILLLDEPTSSLDSVSESIFISNLDKLKEQMTIILVIHNLDMIKNANQIVLMSDGKSHDIDSYDQLLSTQEYKSLKQNQKNPD